MILASAVFIYAALKRPEIVVLGYLLITSTVIDVQVLPRIPIGVGRLLITDIILLAMLGLILIRFLVKSDFRIIHTQLDLPLLAFLGIAILATFLAIGFPERAVTLTYQMTHLGERTPIGQLPLTLNDSLGEARTVFSYLIFFIVINLVREERQLRTLLRGLFFLASGVALLMIAQFLLGNDVPILPGRVETLDVEGAAFMGVTRINPPGEPLVFITFLAMTATLVIDKLQLKRMWIIPLWGLTGLGVVLTFRRNLWIAVFIAFFLLAVLCWRRVWLRMLGGTLVAVSIAAIVLLQVQTQPKSGINKLVIGAFDRLDSLTKPQTFKNRDSSLRWRDFEYKYAMPQIASNSLIGLGLGATYRPWVNGKDWVGKDEEGVDKEADNRRFIHNGHLAIIVKSGMLGYLSFLVFSIIALVRGFKFWQRVPTPEFQAILLGFTLAYLGILIGSIVNPMIMKSNWTPVIGFMLGINEVMLRKVITKPMGTVA